MTDATIEHPLRDAGGPGWAATETRAEVVALTVGMSDFLHRAATAGLRPVVVTGEHSRMTQPLSEALAAVRGAWVVRTASDGLYDVGKGVRVATAQDALTLRAGAVAASGPHPSFLRGAIVSRIQLVTTVSTRHRVTRPVRLGGVVEAASEAFAGSAPTAWGPTEPLVAPWDRDDLTERARRRMPNDTRFAAVTAGERPMIGTVQVARTAEGLEETTRVWADVAGAGEAPGDALAGKARGLLSRAAGIGMPLLGAAFAALGSPDLARRSTVALPPEPLALLIGPPGVRALGVEPKRWAGELGADLVGSPRLPGVLVPLGSPAGGGWQRLADVLGSLDADRVAELLAVAPGVAAQLRAPQQGGS